MVAYFKAHFTQVHRRNNENNRVLFTHFTSVVVRGSLFAHRQYTWLTVLAGHQGDAEHHHRRTRLHLPWLPEVGGIGLIAQPIDSFRPSVILTLFSRSHASTSPTGMYRLPTRYQLYHHVPSRLSYALRLFLTSQVLFVLYHRIGSSCSSLLSPPLYPLSY